MSGDSTVICHDDRTIGWAWRTITFVDSHRSGMIVYKEKNSYGFECAMGDTASKTTVVLIGDSNGAMWTRGFEQVAERRPWRLELMTKSTCPVRDLPTVSPATHREYTECDLWRGEITARLRTEHPKLVFTRDLHRDRARGRAYFPHVRHRTTYPASTPHNAPLQANPQVTALAVEKMTNSVRSQVVATGRAGSEMDNGDRSK